MKYLCLAYYDEKAFDALSKAEVDALVSQCPAYDDELRKSGHLVMQASLGPVRATAALRPSNGKPSFTDGPFAETKEQVGGIFVTTLPDLDEAIRIAALVPAAETGSLEIRPIVER